MVLAFFDSKGLISANHMPRTRPPVHTTAAVTDWMAARQIMLIEHLLYLPDLAAADFFLVPRVKRELAGFILSQKMFKKE